MTSTMRAIVLDAPGPPSALTIRELPVPVPGDGWVLIAVKAFGLNRSELHTRLGLADGVTFPRVLGIEATGVVAACPGGEFSIGQQVVAMMGGMGRVFDGGYAEYTCVPAAQVIAFTSELDWATVGAVPEMLQTSYGSLTVGLDAQPGQSILIRGGTSSVGMATAVLAKRQGMTVLATTRNIEKANALTAIGIDRVLIDGGHIAPAVRDIVPGGVDVALELIGTPTLPDTLHATRVHGVVCFTGMLSNEWTVRDFYPIDYIPRGVRLTAYSGDAADLPADVLQGFLDDVAEGHATVPIDRVYGFDQIVEAHTAMESGTARGKLVVTTGPHCDFSNSVSNHKALNCGDARRLTSCPPGFVSRSCPKFAAVFPRASTPAAFRQKVRVARVAIRHGDARTPPRPQANRALTPLAHLSAIGGSRPLLCSNATQYFMSVVCGFRDARSVESISILLPPCSIG